MTSPVSIGPSGPPLGRPSDPASLLADVRAANVKTQPERLRTVIDSLVRHLFAFAQETELTYEELELGLQFLNAVGKATGPEKNEAILLADVLGVSTLVQLADAKRIVAAGGTESALIGPFWRARQPVREHGAEICSADTAGPRLNVHMRVTDLQRQPVPGAAVDVWQASPVGFYENQDPSQADMNLRGRFITDAQGRLHFRTVRPAGYPIPVDGPVGQLLAAQGRHPMRPAHLHFIVIAEGFRVLPTQIFDHADPHIDDDVVFGAVGSLVRRLDVDPEHPGEFRLDVDLMLEPGETRIPHAPLD